MKRTHVAPHRKLFLFFEWLVPKKATHRHLLLDRFFLGIFIIVGIHGI